jgi:hypothetical protein
MHSLCHMLPDGPRRQLRLAYSVAAVLGAASLIIGCGGGSNESSQVPSGATEILASGAVSALVAPAPVAPAYSWKYIEAPDGSLAATTGMAGMPNLINSSGQLIGSYGFNPPGPWALFHDSRSGTTKSIFDPAEHSQSFPRLINERGDVIVSQRALDARFHQFVWASSTGQLDEIPRGGDFDTEAMFLSSGRIVGGLTDIEFGARDTPLCVVDTTQCVAFHWNAATATLTKHSHFDPQWMNDAATMVGMYLPPGASRSQIATVTPEGAVTRVAAAQALEEQFFAFSPRHIADDGQIIVNVLGRDNLADTFAIRGDSVIKITEGLAPQHPEVCKLRPCSETVQLRNVSRNGHVVGTISLVYRDDAGNWETASETAFHWNAEHGPIVISAGQALIRPVSVNRSGAVIGYIQSEPNTVMDSFVWSHEKGIVRLRTITPGLPPLEKEVEVEVIGDGGHILLRDRRQGSAIMVLTPVNECLEVP